MGIEIGIYQKQSGKNSWMTVLIFLVILIMAIGLGRPTIIGAATVGSDGLFRMAVVDLVNDWPMFHQNLSHTGFSSATGLPTTNTTTWTYTTGGRVFETSPTVVGDIVYVGSEDFNLYALNATNGSRIWSYLAGNVIYGAAAVAGDTVYVGSDDGYLYALNATNGSQIWNYNAVGWIEYSPAVTNDRVYFGAENTDVFALNATNGTLIWRYNTGGAIWSSPAVAKDRVYVGSNDGRLYALNATNGSHIWNYTTGDWVTTSPAILDDRVYVGGRSLYFYALNATNGSQIWNFYVGDYLDSSPAVVNNIVYFGSEDDNLYALNATNGTKIWNYSTGNNIDTSSPAVAGDTVYVGSLDDKLYAINATNGSKIWEYKTGNDITSSPGIGSNGRVYVGSDDNKVYAFGADVTAPNITFVAPTPENNTRISNTSVTVNVSVIDDNSVGSCIIEWKNENMASPVNYTMTKINPGPSVFCNYTNSTLTDGLNYTYKVHVNDSTGNGNVSVIRMFRENAKPTITSVNITPDSPYENHNLTCTVSGGSDAEADTLSYYYQWRKDGALNLTTQNTTLVTNNLTFGNTSAGENWNCAVIPHDGYENGTSKSDDVAILAIPVVTTIPGGSESGSAPPGAAPLKNASEPICGNSICETGENQVICCTDCGCAIGYGCINNKCEVIVVTAPTTEKKVSVMFSPATPEQLQKIGIFMAILAVLMLLGRVIMRKRRTNSKNKKTGNKIKISKPKRF